MATKNEKRAIYESASSTLINPKFTAVDLSKVCGYTYLCPIHEGADFQVEIHMHSGTIFSVRMSEKEFNKLERLWQYWSNEE